MLLCPHQIMSAMPIISPQRCRWRVFPEATGLERAAADLVAAAARSAIAQRGVFHLVLTGGKTPRPIHELLRAIDADWARWQIWFGDERCLPPEDVERNSRMALTTWLDYVAIPPGNIHPIPAELGPRVAASTYAKALAAVPEFDLVLLGLGEDGHTASLFPDRSWQTAHDLPALAVTDSPKPPLQRVSLSPARLAAARQVLFLVTGAGKRMAVKDWQAGVAIPASHIAPAAGVDVYLDAAAGSEAEAREQSKRGKSAGKDESF